MAEFPVRDGDELVTQEFLRAELAELRTEMASGLAGVQTRVTGTLLGAMAVATTVIIAFG